MAHKTHKVDKNIYSTSNTLLFTYSTRIYSNCLVDQRNGYQEN